MNLVTREIEVNGEYLTLTNQRVVYWEKYSALILSDLHVGKTAHFRKNGIALPSNVLQSDLNRLTLLIDQFQPENLIIAGDLLHAGDNSDVDTFCEWRAKYDVKFHLVEGNHDRLTAAL